jgi:energy-coupling factor transport system permease protein
MKEQIAYRPGRSNLHRLHPFAKGIWLLAGTALVFAVRDPWLVLVATALLFASFPLSGLFLGNLRGLRTLIVTALLFGTFQVAFVHRGPVLARIGSLPLTRGGIEAGVYVAGRFLTAVLLSYLYVLTTDPNHLAYALMRAGLPYRYGFALISALRLVPTFEREGQIVYHAQLARGVRYDVRSPRRFLALARQYFLPLLISALGKVDALAVSMEGRCFGRYPTRTFLRQTRWTWRDGAAMVVLVVVVATAIGSAHIT